MYIRYVYKGGISMYTYLSIPNYSTSMLWSWLTRVIFIMFKLGYLLLYFLYYALYNCVYVIARGSFLICPNIMCLLYKEYKYLTLSAGETLFVYSLLYTYIFAYLYVLNGELDFLGINFMLCLIKVYFEKY